jgi:hypothetical protein
MLGRLAAVVVLAVLVVGLWTAIPAEAADPVGQVEAQDAGDRRSLRGGSSMANR